MVLHRSASLCSYVTVFRSGVGTGPGLLVGGPRGVWAINVLAVDVLREGRLGVEDVGVLLATEVVGGRVVLERDALERHVIHAGIDPALVGPTGVGVVAFRPQLLLVGFEEVAAGQHQVRSPAIPAKLTPLFLQSGDEVLILRGRGVDAERRPVPPPGVRGLIDSIGRGAWRERG